MSLWDSLRDAVVDTGSRLGSVAGTAALKAKLNTDLMMIDRELNARKQKFGVEMYDYVSPLSKNQAFYTSDDTLTLTLQPPLITAQREISALELKRNKQNGLIQEAAQVRASAFKPAETWTDKLANAGRSAALGGNEAKLATELAMYNSQILHFKQEFGLNLYKTLEELEDSKQWLPTDREIRSIYDNCRRDVEKIEKKKLAKQSEIKTLMNGGVEEYDPNVVQQSVPGISIQTNGPQPSMYAKQASDMGANPSAGQGVHSMYPVQQQQQPYPQQASQFQQQQQQQPYMQQAPQFQQQPPPMPPAQQQPQAVLHSNLFAGVVPGAAPIPTTTSSGPYGATAQQPQQPDNDPFSAAFGGMASGTTGSATQQFQPHHDPFANEFAPPAMVAPAPAVSVPAQGGYVDPFSGL